jgi:hypothetical protein
MAAPNIVNVASINGKTMGSTLTTSTTTGILTCPSNAVLKVNSITTANIDGLNNADVTVYFYDSSVSSRYALANTISVAADSSLVVVGKDNPIYLEESDRIEAGASAESNLDIIISYEDIR